MFGRINNRKTPVTQYEMSSHWCDDFGDQIISMATILQLKVAKGRLFKKLSLEPCSV